MTASVIQGTKGRNTGVGSIASTAITTSAGSALIAAAIWDTGTFSSIVDSKSNTWTQIGLELTGLGGGSNRARIYYSELDAAKVGASHTVTVAQTSTSAMTLVVIEVGGGTIPGIFDKQAGKTDNLSPFASGATVTTTQAIELIVSALFGTSGSNPATHALAASSTPTSGWAVTAAAEETNGVSFYTGGLANVRVTSTGTYEGSWTETGGADSAVWTATFKEGVAAAASADPSRVQPLLMTLGRQGGRIAKPWAGQSFLPSPAPYVPPTPPTISPLLTRFERRLGRQQMGRILPTESSPRQAYVLNAEVGSYVVTGQAATVRATRLLNASPGSYVVTGQAASLRAARLLNASPGVYVVTGQAASALAARLLNATAGSYAVTGQAATLLRAALLGATPGVYVVSGANALLTQAGGGGPIPVPDQFAVLIPGTDPGAAPRVGNLSQLSDRDFQALAYLSTLDPYLDDVEQFISQVEQDGDEYDDLTSDDFYDSDLSGKVQWRKPRRQ